MEPREKIEVKRTALDRAIEYVFPTLGARRYRARAMMALAGSYLGASRSSRSMKGWNPIQGDADADTVFDLGILRDRSRDLARNSPIAVGAISSAVTNVVGTGLKLQSRIDRDILPLSDQAASDWEKLAEREFRLWAESVDCDTARKVNFAGAQELVFRQVLEAGESFILLPKVEKRGNPYSLKLQIVEGDRVCNKGNAANTKNLVEGIERDDYGAAINYHILKEHPGSMYFTGYQWDVVPAVGAKTNLPNIIHLFRMLRPGQTRGIPYLAPVIETIKQISRYSDAEIMAAVISSFFTVFIKTPAGGLNMDLSGMGAETGAKKDDKDMKLASGAIVGLGQGEEIQIANPARPNAGFAPFMTAVLEQIGTALEIPYEIIVRHFSASYSASRAALLEAWRFFRGRRAWISTNFCQIVYESFLFEAIAAGRIPAPGYFADPMIRKAYSGAVWVGDSPGYIDPSKDIDAAVKRMEAGVSTLDEETTLLTGGDWEKNLPRITKEREELKKIGLWVPVTPKLLPPATPQGGTDK